MLVKFQSYAMRKPSCFEIDQIELIFLRCVEYMIPTIKVGNKILIEEMKGYYFQDSYVMRESKDLTMKSNENWCRHCFLLMRAF